VIQDESTGLPVFPRPADYRAPIEPTRGRYPEKAPAEELAQREASAEQNTSADALFQSPQLYILRFFTVNSPFVRVRLSAVVPVNVPFTVVAEYSVIQAVPQGWSSPEKILLAILYRID